jgi:hypothetical protein
VVDRRRGRDGSSSAKASANEAALTRTTASYAPTVPIEIATPAAKPPNAKPRLRSAPRKPNQRSRSPGAEIAATMLP